MVILKFNPGSLKVCQYSRFFLGSICVVLTSDLSHVNIFITYFFHGCIILATQTMPFSFTEQTAFSGSRRWKTEDEGEEKENEEDASGKLLAFISKATRLLRSRRKINRLCYWEGGEEEYVCSWR